MSKRVDVLMLLVGFIAVTNLVFMIGVDVGEKTQQETNI